MVVCAWQAITASANVSRRTAASMTSADKERIIILFRNDLRVHDNVIVHTASQLAKQNEGVEVRYIMRTQGCHSLLNTNLLFLLGKTKHEPLLVIPMSCRPLPASCCQLTWVMNRSYQCTVSIQGSFVLRLGIIQRQETSGHSSF